MSAKSRQEEFQKPELISEEIRATTLVRAPAEKVYRAITTAEGLDGWFTTEATVEAFAGGKIRFRWKNWGQDHFTGENGGPVLIAEPQKRFVFQWSPDQATYATTVDISFEEVAEGTIIRLREYGYHNTSPGLKKMLNCAAGWGEALTLWKFYVEHGGRY